MSKDLMSESTQIEINSQVIDVETMVSKDFKAIGYALKCTAKPIEPETVALTLYLISKDICRNLNIEFDDLEKNLMHSGTEH